MAFGGTIITRNGRNALAGAQLSGKLEFSHIAIGDGKYTGSFNDISKLSHELFRLTNLRLEIHDDLCFIEADLNNGNLSEGYYFREIGLFAKIDGKEVLYVYDNSGDDAEYISASEGAVSNEKRIRLQLQISSVENITVSTPSVLYATKLEMDDLASEVNTHTEDQAIHTTSGTNIPLVVGTQTATTGAWTGVAEGIKELTDGMMINYYLPYSGSGNATLDLTLADGSTTGAIPCYYRGSSRLTTHINQYGIVQLVYKESGIGGTIDTSGWCMIYNYYQTQTSLPYDNIKVSEVLYRNKWVMRDVNGDWRPIFPDNKTNASVVDSWSVSTSEFLTGSPILYYNNTSTVNEKNVADNMYCTCTHSALYNLNVSSSSLTPFSPVYLKGRIGSVGGFIVDGVDYFVQQLPDTDDGYYYMYVGYMNDVSPNIRLDINHPVYYFKNGKINLYTRSDIIKSALTVKINRGYLSFDAGLLLRMETVTNRGGKITVNTASGSSTIVVSDIEYIEVSGTFLCTDITPETKKEITIAFDMGAKKVHSIVVPVNSIVPPIVLDVTGVTAIRVYANFEWDVITVETDNILTIREL